MAKRVDPFIPVNHKRRPHDSLSGRRYEPRRRLEHPPGAAMDMVTKSPRTKRQALIRLPRRRKPRTIDGVVLPAAGVPRASLQAQRDRILRQRRIRRLRKLGMEVLIVLKKAEERQVVKKARSWPAVAQGVLLILGTVCVGLFISTLVFGELVIAAYAVFALIKRVPSRTTFMLALIALGSVVLLLVIRGGETGLSDNFAVYTFLLLVVGTICLGRETHQGSEG